MKRNNSLLLSIFVLTSIPISFLYSQDEINDSKIDPGLTMDSVSGDDSLENQDSVDTNNKNANEHSAWGQDKQSTFSLNFFSEKTSIKDPFSLRDPFKKPYFLKKQQKENIITSKDGSFTNIPTIESVSINDINIVGILVGKERRALAKVKDNTIIIKEGMIIGDDGVEVKAIYPGGVIFVEKIVNVYGQDEYLETILPVQETKQFVDEDNGNRFNMDKTNKPDDK